MRLLINREDINKYFRVSPNRREEDIERIVRDVQLFDLKPLVCEVFFLDLVKEVNGEDRYSFLLNGGNYGFENFYLQGLKACLSYFFFARYIFSSHLEDTPFGIKEKNYQDGLQISRQERKDFYIEHRQNAHSLWEECSLYLNRNKWDFPEWECCEKKSERAKKVRFSSF